MSRFHWILFFCATTYCVAVNESDVFEWWDNGIISPDEAIEILDLLETGNQMEACILAETYAQETCQQPKEEKKSSKKEKNKVSGFFLHKIRLDSLGHRERQWSEFQISFYRYTLRLGSQELLSYRNQGSEAFFGDISTKEIHSHIPLDTLWGTALLYPLGNIRLAGVLDTSKALEGRLGYIFNKQYELDAFAWRQSQSSFGLQSKFPLGAFSLWWQVGQDFPLMKVQFQDQERPTQKLQRENPHKLIFWNWKISAYIHGDSIPQFARLSSSILKNRVWGMETITATIPTWYNSKFSHSLRFLNPLHSDSVSMRIKSEIESGPDFLRPGISVTCLEANENCKDSRWQGKVQSQWLEHWLFINSIKFTHSREDGFDTPHYETSIKYLDTPQNYSRLGLSFPKGFTLKRMQLRSEIHFAKDFLEISLITTFKKLPSQNLRPSHAFISTKILF